MPNGARVQGDDSRYLPHDALDVAYFLAAVETAIPVARPLLAREVNATHRRNPTRSRYGRNENLYGFSLV